MSKKHIRQDSKIKMSLRLTMGVALFATGAFMFLLILVFNLTRDEISKAQSAMLFKSAECTQDTSEVLRGSINQKVIGVMVETTGKGTMVKINSIVFNAKGTSVPVTQNIENARLWFTGNDPNFNLNEQSGNTIAKISDDDFEIACNQNINAGKNYFWLTYDVKADAMSAPATVDAQCMEIKSGAVSYKPITIAPVGKRFIEANIPYFSTGNNVLNNLMTWNTKRDGSGIPPKQLTASRNSFFIQSGHHIVNGSPGNLQTVVVEKGGELRITAPLRLNTMNIACNGMVQMDCNVTDYYCFTEFYMDNNANYIHNNTGYLPGLHCHFNPNSNCVFYQYGAATLPYHIAWGNVLIDVSSPINVDMQKNFDHVAGNFEIKKTGKDNYLFCGNSDTINIGGSFIMNGGIFMGMAGNNEGRLVINIENDFMLTEGCFYDAGIISNKAAGTILNIKGDVTLIGGVFDFNRSKDGLSEINMCNTTVASRWTQKPSCEVTLGNVNVTANSKLQLKGDKMGAIAKGKNITVHTDAEMMCGTSTVYGDGIFNLSDNATLGIASADGINSTGKEGNIITTVRKFNSGANYCYYANANPQIMGKFTTYPEENTVRTIILNKEKTSQILTVMQPFTVMEQIKINRGDIDQSQFKLLLPRLSEKQ